MDGSGNLKLVAGASLDFESEPSVSVNVTATDTGGLDVVESFTITTNNVNETPTAIALSNASVDENADGAIIGAVSVTDPDVGDSHTFQTSDARFEVDGSGNLKLVAGASLDFESEPNVSVNVTATDSGGLDVVESFSITVNDVNETPTAIALSNASVDENADGAIIGAVTVYDPDAGDSHTFQTSDARFEVDGSGNLKLVAGASLDFESEPSVSVNVTATDSGGLDVVESFSVTVNDVNETPTAR